MRTDHYKLSALAALIGALVCMCSLVACGSAGGTTISASAIARCAHASTEPTSSIPSGSVSLRTVVGKTTQGGWLHQNAELSASSEAELQAQEQKPQFDLLVFPSAKVATEAFKLIQDAPNPQAEYGAAGGTFQRGNIVISTEQVPPGSLTALAETLLNKCVGAGATESVLRSQASPSPSDKSSTGQESEAPSESQPSQGQSPVPGEAE